MKEGASLEKIEDLANYAASPHYTERERAALELADRMTRTDLDVTDASFETLKQHFSTEELVELAAVIATENFRSKFNNAFRIEPQGFCLIP